MNKVVDYISSKIGLRNRNLLEKDIILQTLLYEISNVEYLNDNLVFKGGTCLTKCYLGYYRFSEDIDFSWKDQSEFKDKSQKEIRRLLSSKIEKIGLLLEEIAKKHSLDFKYVKSNKKYFDLGGSNKFTTFKIWYKSTISNNEQFIKIQINFVELFLFDFKLLMPKSIIKDIDAKEFKFLFPEYGYLSFDFKINCYDVREIFCEKFRAVLTRKAVKVRDFIDIFLISKRKNLDFNRFEKQIMEKTRFMLQYSKYVQNLEDFKLEKFVLGEEEKLLFVPIESGIEEYLAKLHLFLDDLAKKLKK